MEQEHFGAQPDTFAAGTDRSPVAHGRPTCEPSRGRHVGKWAWVLNASLSQWGVASDAIETRHGRRFRRLIRVGDGTRESRHEMPAAASRSCGRGAGQFA
jgi:hypothetical protein